MISVQDIGTNSTGQVKNSGTAPNTVASGWTYKSSFAGDSSYLNSTSTTNSYSTLKHNVQLTLVLKPTSVSKGGLFSVNGTLKDATVNNLLSTKIISFTTSSPLHISNVNTDVNGKYLKSGIIAPSISGKYSVQSKFSATSLYNAGTSPKLTLTVS